MPELSSTLRPRLKTKPPERDVRRNIASVSTSLATNLWELELLGAEHLARRADDIIDLSSRSLDQNVFFEPESLQAFWPTMEPILAPDGMGVLMLYEQFGLERYLRLCMPVRFLPKTMFKPAVMQLTATEFSPHGALLVDRDVVREACEILLELLPQRGLGLPPLLDLPEQLADSDVSLELRAAAQRLGLPSLPSRNYERALLEFPESRSSNAGAEFDIIPSLVSKRRRKEFTRQQNRLAECGALTFEILTRPKEVRNAFNEFMDLENRGWKGRNQSSLLSKDETALFARDMVTNLARRGLAEVHVMRLDGAMIGALTLLGRKDSPTAWKISYDESYAAYSPGALLLLQVTREIAKRPGFQWADSLAIPDHPLIDKIWRGRRAMLDYAIALDPKAKPKLVKYTQARRRHHVLRGKARKVRRWLKPRLRRLRLSRVA